jgi:hypothetical protein
MRGSCGAGFGIGSGAATATGAVGTAAGGAAAGGVGVGFGFSFGFGSARGAERGPRRAGGFGAGAGLGAAALGAASPGCAGRGAARGPERLAGRLGRLIGLGRGRPAPTTPKTSLPPTGIATAARIAAATSASRRVRSPPEFPDADTERRVALVRSAARRGEPGAVRGFAVAGLAPASRGAGRGRSVVVTGTSSG